ncbi:MAG TPA: hypothetical protein VM183_01175 [Burkholderiales bacterium]|nr:hypothetical protein [Burkholderiales bacterium]
MSSSRLFTTLKMLNAAGILAAAFREESGRLRVWIGDDSQGVLASNTFESHESANAWLQEKALLHYPNSTYAKVRRLLTQALGQAQSSQDR